jgi:nucleoside-diphosphate-sugar epimerase
VRIFLTGGTGYIGAAVLDALTRAGHRVHALVRNSHNAAHVQKRGATPVHGELGDPASYADAGAAADGIIHTAFEYSARGPQLDKTAVDALLTAAAQSKTVRCFIYTSSVWVLGNAPSPTDETAPVNPIELSKWRPAQEQRVLNAATPTLRTVVVRPGIVYGGARGIVGDILKDAANSLVRVIGSGDNRWPLIYDRDLADLYLRLVDRQEASGIFHANDEGDERVNDIVAAIGEHAKTTPSVRHIPITEARQKMGPYADGLALDQVVRSPRARALGWSPSLKSVSGNAARLFEEWRRAAMINAE